MNRSFLRHAAVYGLANIIVQAASLVLLPLYTRYLSPADYGVFEVVGRLAETISACLLIGGLRQALMTHFQQAESPLAKARVVSAAMTLLAVCCLAGGGLALAMADPICSLLAARGTQLGTDLVRLGILTILLEPLTLLPLTLLQARLESVPFVAVTIGQFLVRVNLTIVLVVCFGWGVAGVLIATALTSLLLGTGLCLREMGRYAVLPDWKALWQLFCFALPFLPNGLCFFVLHHGDRFLLWAWHGKEEVGTYALGYKLALAAATFTSAPLQMVWGAKMYAAARTDDAPIIFGQVFTRCLGCILFASLGLFMFTTEAVALLGPKSYAAAGVVVLPVLLACICQGAATLMVAAFYIRNRPGLKLGVTLVTTAVMTTAYFLLIPAWGSMGAAVATLIGFLFLMVGTWVVTRRIFPVRYEYARLAVLVGLSAVVAALAAPLPAMLWAVPIKCGLLLLWPLVLWNSGLVSADEKAYVRSLLSWIGMWLSRRFATPQVPENFGGNPLLGERRGVSPPVSSS